MPKLTLTQDKLALGDQTLGVRLIQLCDTGEVADYELVPEEPLQPRWRVFKRGLAKLGFTRDRRHPRYDRFNLGSIQVSLTHDGRLIIRHVSPPGSDRALAVAALFLLAEGAG
ncbi:MAG: hypothetical protein GF399_06855 [Candidatus Coatesbacteria bacterium]|nr:hypothetical protein [Candidatus Coatesbacteria bacterium]